MMQFKILQDLDCSRAMQHGLFYDSLRNILLFELGGAVKAAEKYYTYLMTQ